MNAERIEDLGELYVKNYKYNINTKTHRHCRVPRRRASSPFRLRGELLLDAFVLLSKLPGRDAERKCQHSIERPVTRSSLEQTI